jgi:Tol biopolymer transport system component
MRTALILVTVVLTASCSTSGRNDHGGGGAAGSGGGGSGGTGGNGPPATHDVVDPSLPPGVVGGFDGAPPGTAGLTLVYPNAGAMIPHDLAPIDAQWNGAAQVYRVTFAVDNGNKLRGYVKSPDWIPPAAEWQWLLDVAAGHTITLSVDGAATIDGNGTPQGPLVGAAGQPLSVAHDDATGALFYFATTGDQISGDGTLERLQLGAQKADKYLNKTNDGSGLCVGCHSISRDGARVAFTFLNLAGAGSGTTMSLGSVDATNPTMQQAAANTTAATSSFSPDGKKLVTAYNGKLSIRDAVTGALVQDLTTSGVAMFPDWSPDGNTIVFVKPATACTPGLPNFGQASIYAYGGSLATLTSTGGTFGNEKTILAAASGENNYYPSFSPDGKWIAFTRAQSATKSSWSVANSACTGQDGSGLSYDNPSATVMLMPAAGGTPVALTHANGAAMKTNSWPKWGPKADGDYLWLSFSSTREYGNVLTGLSAHHQIWITSIPRGTTDLSSGEPSTPAVWFPFQDTATKNHIGVWSVKVGGYTIP